MTEQDDSKHDRLRRQNKTTLRMTEQDDSKHDRIRRQHRTTVRMTEQDDSKHDRLRRQNRTTLRMTEQDDSKHDRIRRQNKTTVRMTEQDDSKHDRIRRQNKTTVRMTEQDDSKHDRIRRQNRTTVRMTEQDDSKHDRLRRQNKTTEQNDRCHVEKVSASPRRPRGGMLSVKYLAKTARVIQGSFHQGDARFGWNRNRQCAVNSMTAVMMSVLKDVLTWTTEDLNAVLLHGDELYTSMRLQGKINDPTGFGHVSVAELPRVHTLNKTTFTIKHGESFSGVIGVDFYDESLRDVSMSIEEALQRALLQCDSCLLNIKEYICAIIKAGSTFAIINPHSYNAKGMPECDGTSIVVYCDDVYMLFNHVVNLAMSLDAQGTPFEVTSVKAMVIGKTTTMETSSKSGQEGSVSHISPTITVEDSKCIGDHDKPEDKVASILHVSPTSTVEDRSETNIASETDNVSQIEIASETTNASDTAIASEPAGASKTANDSGIGNASETPDASGIGNASQMYIASEPATVSETADASETAIVSETATASETAIACETADDFGTADDSGIANAS
ncbi:hypothetical protein ROHU_021577 [Labeo rohita]|uniref:Peptidase C76 domain-containing protein n=1 Tax=Labeo rohita TaxID=84645 RepID=A0A498N0L8_LABRO|nr:hypothetical protein ROHU_021577 [Labeo rohita]